MSQIALEKRMNEIRRLERVNNDLLEALKFCLSVLKANPVEMSERMAIDKARDAIEFAQASHPA